MQNQNPAKSYSMRQMFKACPRKIYWRYIAGVKPVKPMSKALITGTYFHRGLEALRSGDSVDEAHGNIVDEYAGDLEAITSDLVEIDSELIKLYVYLKGYDLYFANDKLSTWEVESLMTLSKEIAYIDAIERTQYGDLYIIENKTTSYMSGSLTKSLKLNEQIHNYVLMALENGVRAYSVKYRETLKSRMKIKKNKESLTSFQERLLDHYLNPDNDCYRETVVTPTKMDLVLARKNNAAWNADIDKLFKAKKLEQVPYNCQSCMGLYGACDYLPLCSDTAEVNSYMESGKQPLDDGEALETLKNKNIVERITL
jgi:hypothetical protein